MWRAQNRSKKKTYHVVLLYPEREKKKSGRSGINTYSQTDETGSPTVPAKTAARFCRRHTVEQGKREKQRRRRITYSRRPQGWTHDVRHAMYSFRAKEYEQKKEKEEKEEKETTKKKNCVRAKHNPQPAAGNGKLNSPLRNTCGLPTLVPCSLKPDPAYLLDLTGWICRQERGKTTRRKKKWRRKREDKKEKEN